MSNGWKNIRRFFGYIKYINADTIVYFICEIYDALQPIFVIQITTNIIKAIESGDKNQLFFLIKIFVILIVLNYITGWLGEIMHDRAFNKIESKLTTEYMNKYIAMDQTETEKYGTGRLNNVFSNATNSICAILLETGLAVSVEILGLGYAIFLLATKSPTIYHFFGILGIMIIGLLFLAKGLSMIQKARKINKGLSMEIDRQRTKVIMSKFEILQNNKIDIENKKIEGLFMKSAKLWTIANTKKHLRQVWTNILFDGARIYIYLGMGLAVISGEYKIAYMLLFLELLRLSDKYLRNIRGYFRDIYKESVNIEKLRDIIDTTKSFDYNTGDNFFYKSGNYSLKDVEFGYGSNPIFKKFSLQINGGRKTAFVGESGGGKTTLIKLLAGYIRPDSGEIEIDGQKLSEIKLTDYYKHIGYLTQEPSVFDGTIYENLVYALDKEPDKKELEKVIKLAKCEFIREFEHGLETEIGERGVRLSGGQKQRLAIAKIMLKNPKIILLDEPTSALDSFNEEQISIALHNLFKGKTVIVVAHRLQTVKEADRILLFEQGKIIEDGNHEELIKKNGKYKKMLDLQSGF